MTAFTFFKSSSDTSSTLLIIIVLQNSIMLVIPKEKVEMVLEISKKIEEMENNILKAINNNMTLKEARGRFRYDDIK